MFKFLLFSSVLFSSFAFADTFIQLRSEKGERIGKGEVTRLENNIPFTSTSALLRISHESGYSFSFLATHGQQLQPGVYSNAIQTPLSPGKLPGLEVKGYGRTCYQINGEFVIYEFDLVSNPNRIALDFVQYCDNSDKKLTGSIRINSDLPDPYPYPVAVIKANQAKVNEGAPVVIQGQSSFSKVATITNYSWSQIEGKKLNGLQDTNQAELKLTAPTDVAVGGEKSKLRLTVTDSLGLQDSEDFVLTTRSKSDPQSYFRFESAEGDYIGGGRTEFFDQNNATFWLYGNSERGVSIIVNTDYTSWYLNFSAPNNHQLAEGEFKSVELFPSRNAGYAGLSVSGERRECIQINGSFKVHQLLMDKNNHIFKASFEQRCSGSIAPLLKGEVAINARHESVPKARAGDDIQINEHALVNLNGSDSVDLLGSLISYRWTLDDATVQLEGADTSRVSFLVPALPDRVFSKTYLATLLVTDNEGYKAQDEVKITVHSNNKNPQATDDSFELEIGKSLSLNLQKNDTDADGRIAADSIELIKQPLSGTVKINADGTVLYSHTGTIAGSDSFSYRMKDNDGAWSNEARVSLSIKQKVETPVEKPIEKPAETNGGSGGSWSFSALLLLMLALFNRHKIQLRQPQN